MKEKVRYLHVAVDIGKNYLHSIKEKQKKSTDGGKLYRIAFSNLARNKKKTVVVITSLSLAVVLLNSVFTITNSFDMDTYLKKFVTSDFLIANARYFGMDHYWGFDEETDTWDVIVKYSGDLKAIESESIHVVELLNEYAIVTLKREALEQLAAFPQVEYIEKPKRLFFGVNQGREASCMEAVQNARFDLFGQGVLVAVIESGVDYAHPDFRNKDGST